MVFLALAVICLPVLGNVVEEFLRIGARKLTKSTPPPIQTIKKDIKPESPWKRIPGGGYSLCES